MVGRKNVNVVAITERDDRACCDRFCFCFTETHSELRMGKLLGVAKVHESVHRIMLEIEVLFDG